MGEDADQLEQYMLDEEAMRVMPEWKSYVKDPSIYLGLIPTFLSESDPRPAAEQFHTNYSHGGGWDPFEGFKFNPKTLTIAYPGDPPIKPAAECTFRAERIIVYPSAWVLILQPDGKYEIARMD